MGCVLILFSFDANTQEEEKLNLDQYLALAQIFWGERKRVNQLLSGVTEFRVQGVLILIPLSVLDEK